MKRGARSSGSPGPMALSIISGNVEPIGYAERTMTERVPDAMASGLLGVIPDEQMNEFMRFVYGGDLNERR